MGSFRAYVRLVRENRNFRRLWLAQIVSEIGDWFYALSVYSLILELTGSAKLVGLAVVVQVLPQTLAAPTAGVVNDRMSRKRVMILADLMRAAIVLGMLLVRTREMIWLIFPLLFFETIGWAFFEPGHSAAIPAITGMDDTILANTLSATTWSFCQAIGSALGGVVAAGLGRNAVFILNALSFLGSAALLAGMRFEEPHVNPVPLRPGDLIDFSPIVEGVRYVRRDPRLLAMVFVKGGLGFLGANLVILPLLGERVFPVHLAGLDASRAAMIGMSILMGARGVGALIGPVLTVPFAGGKDSHMRIGILCGFVAIFFGYLALGWAPMIGLACVALILAHGGGSTIWVFSTTLLQKNTEDRFRGRVFSADLGLNTLAVSLTSYLAGVFIDRGIPVQRYAVATGVSLLVPACAWALAMRLWRKPIAA